MRRESSRNASERHRLRAGVLAFTALAAAASVSAVPPEGGPAVKPLAIEDAVSSRSFHVQGRWDYSSKGDWVAYTVCDPKLRKADPRDKYATFSTPGSAYLSMGCDIWLSAAERDEKRNITQTKGNNWGPSFSPDGKRLAFFSDRGGLPQVWIGEVESGKVRLASSARTRSRLGFEPIRWTPDGRSITVRLHPEGMTEDQLEAPPPAAGPAEEKEPGSTVVIYNSRPATPPTPGKEAGPMPPGDSQMGDLGLIDVASGKVRRVVSHARFSVHWLSPDGTRAAYLDNKGRKSPQSLQSIYDLVVVDLATGKATTLVSGVNQGFGTSVSWSPDGKWLAYYVGGMTAKATCWVVSAAGGPPRKLEGAADIFEADYLPPVWSHDSGSVFAVGGNAVWRGNVAAGTMAALTRDLGPKVYEVLQTTAGNEAWSPDGKSIYTMRRDQESKKGIYLKVDLATGAVTPVLAEDKSFGRVFDTPLVSPDGKRVAYVAQSGKESEDLWIAGVDFQSPRRLSAINPKLDAYTFGATRLIEFTNDDGKKLHAAVLLPAGYQEGKRYPTVVMIYPQDWGSESVNAFGLGGLAALNMQMLATRGYVVLQPDVPTGKGTIMQDLMKSVMPAIDRAVALGFADSDRLAVTGQSAGGYSTLAMIVQTTRFKAAVMNSGFGDLTAFYGAMSLTTGDGVWVPWLETLTGGMGQGPWDAPQAFMQNSPIYFLNRIQTPIIVQAGGNDLAIVPYSDQVFAGLKRLNKDATYLRYAGEGHVLAIHANLVDYWKRVVQFLDKHLKGDPVPKA